MTAFRIMCYFCSKVAEFKVQSFKDGMTEARKNGWSTNPTGVPVCKECTESLKPK